MSKFTFDSLVINGFRAFKHLSIARLGRVNLITGKNNVGKTAFLEALYLYAHRGSPTTLWELLEQRDEGRRPPNTPVRNRSIGGLFENIESDQDSGLDSSSELNEQFLELRNLFYGRHDIREETPPIQIGSVHNEQSLLDIKLEWQANGLFIQILSPVIRSRIPISYLADRDIRSEWNKASVNAVPSQFIRMQGLDKREVGRLWDKAILSNMQNHVLDALRIIGTQGHIENVNMVGEQLGGILSGRVPVVKLAGLNHYISLRSMGEGMNRLFGLCVALINVQEGILLVDEIESGVHYSAQLKMWELVFQMARLLNIQVFATTHSWDCIDAFAQASIQDNQSEGMLIRLDSRSGDVVPTLFDESRLDVVTREKIEVR